MCSQVSRTTENSVITRHSRTHRLPCTTSASRRWLPDCWTVGVVVPANIEQLKLTGHSRVLWSTVRASQSHIYRGVTKMTRWSKSRNLKVEGKHRSTQISRSWQPHTVTNDPAPFGFPRSDCRYVNEHNCVCEPCPTMAKAFFILRDHHCRFEQITSFSLCTYAYFSLPAGLSGSVEQVAHSTVFRRLSRVRFANDAAASADMAPTGVE